MGFYDKHLLPRLVHLTCSQSPAMRQREKVVPLAEGNVLEIGIGTGLNIPFYDPCKVKHLWGLDPSAEMWSIACKNAEDHHIDAEFVHSAAESIPLDDHCADTILLTYTLCSIPDLQTAMAEIRRVLKPAGRLIFCEHGAAPDQRVLRWQNRMNPVWKRLAGGCHLNRSVPDILRQEGFTSNDMQTMYLPGWKPASFNYWGTARILENKTRSRKGPAIQAQERSA